MPTIAPADDPLRDDRLLDTWVARLGEELADLEREASPAVGGADPGRRAACRARIAATKESLRADYFASIAARPRRPLARRGLAGYRRWRHGRRMMRFRSVVHQALAELDRLDATLADDGSEVGSAGTARRA
jgi:hypothetical protein